MTPDLPRQKIVDFKNYFSMQSQNQQFEDYAFNVNFATTTTQPDLQFDERSLSKPLSSKKTEELTLEKIKKKNMTTSEVIQIMKEQLKESATNDTPKQSPMSKVSESDPLWAYSDKLKVELNQMAKSRYKNREKQQ